MVGFISLSLSTQTRAAIVHAIYIDDIKQAIDKALDERDEKRFMSLTSELLKLRENGRIEVERH